MADARPPWHRRLSSRYAAAFATVALGSSLAVAVPMYVVAARFLEATLDERLEGIAEIIALSSGSDVDNSRLDTLREEADLDALFIVTPSGEVLASSGAGPLDLTATDAAALRTALAADAAVTPIQRDAAGAPFLSAFAPTEDGSRAVGLRVSASYLARLGSLRAVFAVAMVAWGALSAILGAALGASLTRPIQRLVRATDRLAGGEAPEPPEAGGAAELDTLQAAFSTMAASVRRRETELRALAGAVAHEVRNPSHALRLHLGLLRRQLGPMPEPVRERVDTLQRELDVLDATVDAFLVFARANAARRETVELRSLLAAHADGAEVEAPTVEVDADPLLLGRAIANLVRNAREAGGDPVRIHAGLREEDLWIDVEDHGPGFPDALLTSAFEPFVTGRAQGSGLGLAIVAAVAAAHGGSAEVTRSGPKGATVTLRLPRAAPGRKISTASPDPGR